MADKYYGKEIDLLCPVCERPMKTTLRRGGWSVDCQFASLFTFIKTGENRCEFDYHEWDSNLYVTEEEAIDYTSRCREVKEQAPG